MRRMLAVVGVLAAAVPASAQYRIIDLGTLGGDESYVVGINDRGQIAGVADTPEGERHAVLWNPLPRVSALRVSKDTGVAVSLTATPLAETTTYGLETSNAPGGLWSAVPDAVLTELEPDRYQFTLPFDAARAAAFWRVIETVP